MLECFADTVMTHLKECEETVRARKRKKIQEASHSLCFSLYSSYSVENSCCHQNFSPYICNDLVPGLNIGMKREIRCNCLQGGESGAIPVAVRPPNPQMGELGNLILHCHCLKNGKAIRLGSSQKTCQIINNIMLSGEKLKCKGHRTFIFLSYFPEAVTKKIFQR